MPYFATYILYAFASLYSFKVFYVNLFLLSCWIRLFPILPLINWDVWPQMAVYCYWDLLSPGENLCPIRKPNCSSPPAVLHPYWKNKALLLIRKVVKIYKVHFHYFSFASADGLQCCTMSVVCIVGKMMELSIPGFIHLCQKRSKRERSGLNQIHLPFMLSETL